MFVLGATAMLLAFALAFRPNNVSGQQGNSLLHKLRLRPALGIEVGNRTDTQPLSWFDSIDAQQARKSRPAVPCRDGSGR